jgi:tetratricopeptide (TPR) repeat protein
VDSHSTILAGAYRNWGVLLREMGKQQDAETAHRKAVQLSGENARDFPTVAYYQGQLGYSQLELGKTLAATGQAAKSKAAFEAAHAVFAGLAEKFPENQSYAEVRDEAHRLWRQDESGMPDVYSPIGADSCPARGA